MPCQQLLNPKNPSVFVCLLLNIIVKLQQHQLPLISFSFWTSEWARGEWGLVIPGFCLFASWTSDSLSFGFRHQGGAAAGSWIVLAGCANPDCAIFLATSLILGGLKPLFSLLTSQSDWCYLFRGLRENLRERGRLWMWYLEMKTVFPKPSSPLAHNGN